jgi:hypothetical protein
MQAFIEQYWPTVAPYVTSWVRGVLFLAAGYLAQHGIIQASSTDQFVQVGLAVLIGAATQAWSWWQKHHQQQKIKIALATPPPS